MSKNKPSQRKSNSFHARNPHAAPPATEPAPEPGHHAPQYNALRHGAYAASLDATAGRLGEDPAEVAALLAELWACYAPADGQEARVVERLAATWRRLNRLSAHAQSYLRDRLDGGALPLFALKESEAASGEEARLERALLRLHRHLEFLQRWRVAAAQRRVAQAHRDAQTEIEALLELDHAQSVRLIAEARERLYGRERAAQPEEDPAQDAVGSEQDGPRGEAADAGSPDGAVGGNGRTPQDADGENPSPGTAAGAPIRTETSTVRSAA